MDTGFKLEAGIGENSISDRHSRDTRDRNPDVGIVNGIPERTMAAGSDQPGHVIPRDAEDA